MRECVRKRACLDACACAIARSHVRACQAVSAFVCTVSEPCLVVCVRLRLVATSGLKRAGAWVHAGLRSIVGVRLCDSRCAGACVLLPEMSHPVYSLCVCSHASTRTRSHEFIRRARVRARARAVQTF